MNYFLCKHTTCIKTLTILSAHMRSLVRAFTGRFCTCTKLSFAGAINKTWYGKYNKMSVYRVKTLISLGICQGWSESSLCAQLAVKDPNILHAKNEDSNQTELMPSLNWVTLLVFVVSRFYFIFIQSPISHVKLNVSSDICKACYFRIQMWFLLLFPLKPLVSIKPSFEVSFKINCNN